MASNIQAWLKGLERRWRGATNRGMATPRDRAWSLVNYHVFDHAFLRMLWHNYHPVAEGVFRSNQPTHARLRKMKRDGIKTIVNLRGETGLMPFHFETESCEELGLDLISTRVYARRPTPADEILQTVDILRTAPKPLVFHCKSGADRAGFAAVLYLMIVKGKTWEEAKSHLSFKYLHLDSTATGIIDHFFRLYNARNDQNPIALEDWIRTEYDPNELGRSFAEWQAARKAKS
jgi:protein tyrosine/serine phosphatase